jgi:hypothetical protein
METRVAEACTMPLKPVIRELLRTELCIEPVKLLVDKIHVTSRIVEEEVREAYLIWLSDGEQAIQGIQAGRRSGRAPIC